MAKFFGVNWTGALAGPTRTPIVGGDGGGNQRSYYDEYVTLGTEVIGDTIDFGPPQGGLKMGDRVIGGFLNADAFGVNTTLAVGDDGSAARYVAATNVNAAQHVFFTTGAGLGFQVDQDRPCRVTIAGANCPVGKKIRVNWEVTRS